MAKISKDSLKGYLLEEVLAYLIRNTGYKLLVDPKQDERDLGWERNSLVVKGRGTTHQVDVLGELEWIPAFTYPLRLIIEAKFRKGKTNVGVIRNAVGVLFDVSQNNSPSREQDSFSQKYQYTYAVASTSGFSKSAMQMAIAHQISIIDLSISEYNNLKDSITESAGRLLQSIEDHDIKKGKLINGIRYLLRKNLGTQPEVETDFHLNDNLCSSLSLGLEPMVMRAKEYKELFVGMANGPFMLLLKADAPSRFLNYAKKQPTHKIVIRWSLETDPNTWVIHPIGNTAAYRLTFKLPEQLRKWIFEVHEKRKERAIQAKQRYFSNITIYRRIDEQDYLFRLKFDLEETQRNSIG